MIPFYNKVCVYVYVCVCVCCCADAHRFSVILLCNKVIHVCVCVYTFVDAQFSTILFNKCVSMSFAQSCYSFLRSLL